MKDFRFSDHAGDVLQVRQLGDGTLCACPESGKSVRIDARSVHLPIPQQRALAQWLIDGEHAEHGFEQDPACQMSPADAGLAAEERELNALAADAWSAGRFIEAARLEGDAVDVRMEVATQPGIGTVKAKDAPLGVQLWPTVSPQYAPNFTLDTVTRQLGSNGREYVIWQYQNGNTRMFLADEDVAVQIVSAAE